MKYTRITIEKWKSDVKMIIGFLVGVLITAIIVWTTQRVEAQQEFLSPIPENYVIWKEKEQVFVPIMKSNVLDVVNAIHTLESSRGKAKIGLQAYCEALGQTNEYGYGGMAMKLCFRTANEAKGRVALWVLEKLDKYDGNVRKVACMYNLGVETDQCEYADKLESLIQ